MLTGKQLGHAIAEAIRLKGVTQKDVAKHFGVKPPSIQDWIKRGTIDKAKLPGLWHYFSDVVDPKHWGFEAFPVDLAPEKEHPPASDTWPFPLISPRRFDNLPDSEKEIIEALVLRRIVEWEAKNSLKREAG